MTKDNEEFNHPFDNTELNNDDTFETSEGSALKKEGPNTTESSRKKYRRRKYDKRQKENKVVKKIVLIVLSLLILTLVLAGFTFYSYFKSSLKPLDSSSKKLVQVEIPVGSSTKQIGQILENKKVIKDGLVFSYYVKMNNLTNFQAGFYQMSPSMTLDTIADNLQEGGTAEPQTLADAKVTVPEGYSVDQIAALLAKKTKFKKDEFLNLMKNEEFFNKMVGKYPELLTSAKEAKEVRYRLEGYLYPATYNYYEKMTLEELVEQMVSKTNQVLTPLYAEMKEKKMSVQEVLTIASLVEKEGVKETDRRKIAQVFFNRLDTDMPLQSDISILYALEKHKVHLSIEDTQVKSPYNLYVNKGTGPGPFNNPSEQAVAAVLNPEENTYVYFLADVATGKVYYANTYEEHLELKAKYIDNKN
ncbi:endolytic transglycosylase MltG [Vagococcus sp.]|uniref:endolytic transglycosylase MltG n=1 Tax=Vagococcus sp. TaxID=1933889 RepID=UPI003F9D155B